MDALADVLFAAVAVLCVLACFAFAHGASRRRQGGRAAAWSMRLGAAMLGLSLATAASPALLPTAEALVDDFDFGFVAWMLWWGLWAGPALVPCMLTPEDFEGITRWRPTALLLAVLFTVGMAVAGGIFGLILAFALRLLALSLWI